MEQQRLSVAKAGIMTTLNTRTIVIATCNPRGKYDVSQDLSVNTSIASPLLSRFDLTLLLLDNSNKKVRLLCFQDVVGLGSCELRAQQQHQHVERRLQVLRPLPLYRCLLAFT